MKTEKKKNKKSSRFSFYKHDNVDNEYKSKLYELNVLLNTSVTIPGWQER